MIAAACVGGMASAIIGTDTPPMPPPRPPLDIPVRMSAGIASA